MSFATSTFIARRRRASSHSSTSSISTSSSTSESAPSPTFHKPMRSSRRRNHSIGEAAIMPALLLMRSELFTPKEQPEDSVSKRDISPPSPIETPAIMITDEEGNEEIYHDDEVYMAPLESLYVTPVRETLGRRRRGRSVDLTERGRGRARDSAPVAPCSSRRVKISEKEIID